MKFRNETKHLTTKHLGTLPYPGNELIYGVSLAEL